MRSAGLDQLAESSRKFRVGGQLASRRPLDNHAFVRPVVDLQLARRPEPHVGVEEPTDLPEGQDLEQLGRRRGETVATDLGKVEREVGGDRPGRLLGPVERDVAVSLGGVKFGWPWRWASPGRT